MIIYDNPSNIFLTIYIIHFFFNLYKKYKYLSPILIINIYKGGLILNNTIFLIGALLVNFFLIIGLLQLPSIGTKGVENIYTLIWVTFGVLINISFLRKAKLNIRDRRTNYEKVKKQKRKEFKLE